MVTSIKIDIFLLVTARPIAHSGKFVCIRNGVGEFGMDSGQPLVTRKECESAGVIITRRITLIFECMYKVYALLCGIWVNFWSATKCIIMGEYRRENVHHLLA